MPDGRGPSRPARVRDWSKDELAELDRTPLIRVAPERADGRLRAPVVIGHVRIGAEELVRSLNGREGAWYRAAVATGIGEIELGDRRLRVSFVPDGGREDEVDRALRRRYGDDAGVRRMTASPAREATLRIVPLEEPWHGRS